MKTKKRKRKVQELLRDERGVSKAVDFILVFAITIMVFGLILITFSNYVMRANEIGIRERFKDIGNDISLKIQGVYQMGGDNGSAYTKIVLPNDVNGIPFDVKIVGNRSDSLNPLRIVVAAQRANSEAYVTLNELDENVNLSRDILTSGGTYTIMYENRSIWFYPGWYALPIILLNYSYDLTPPDVIITWPWEGIYIGGVLQIMGTAWDQNFSYYRVYWNNTSQPAEGSELISSTSSVQNNILAPNWDTTMVNESNYTIKLSAYDLNNNTNTTMVNVSIDNTLPAFSNQSLIGLNNSSRITNYNRPRISVNYSDLRSGINISTIVMTIDGIVVVNNTLNFNNASNAYISHRPSTPLSDGTHIVNITIGDNTTPSNLNTTSFNFTIEPLEQICYVINGTDTSGTILHELNSSELNALNISASNRMRSNDTWPKNLNESKYIQFNFTPNLQTNITIKEVLLNHTFNVSEYRSSPFAQYAKLKIYNSTTWNDLTSWTSNSTAEIITTNFNITQTNSEFYDVQKVNNIKIRFISYYTRSGSQTMSYYSYHDYVQLKIRYYLED